MPCCDNTPKRTVFPPFEGRFDDDAGRTQWVRKYRPEVVVGFSAHDWYALRDAGFDIPSELGYVALQLDRVHESGQKIAGLVQQSDLISRQSIVVLDQLIRHNQRGVPESPLETLVPSRWHDGQSVRAAL